MPSSLNWRKLDPETPRPPQESPASLLKTSPPLRQRRTRSKLLTRSSRQLWLIWPLSSMTQSRTTSTLIPARSCGNHYSTALSPTRPTNFSLRISGENGSKLTKRLRERSGSKRVGVRLLQLRMVAQISFPTRDPQYLIFSRTKREWKLTKTNGLIKLSKCSWRREVPLALNPFKE